MPSDNALENIETGDDAKVCLDIGGHPVVCKLLDVVRTEDQSFAILEIVDGPAPGLLVRHYKLVSALEDERPPNEDRLLKAFVSPIEDEWLEEHLVEDYQYHLLALAA